MKSLYTPIPEFIYEAIVTEVFYKTGTCTLSPLSPIESDLIHDVPMPNMAGNKNSGIFYGIEIGSRVVAMNTSGDGREFTVIATTLPKSDLFKESFQKNKPRGTPAGTTSYPELAAGRVIIRSGAGTQLCLEETGCAGITTSVGSGLYIKKKRLKTTAYSIFENIASFSEASKSFSGTAHRTSAVQREIFRYKDISELPLLAVNDHTEVAAPVGFFTGSAARKRGYGKKKRNPEISEHKIIINEFSSESMFSGFDDELWKSQDLNKVGFDEFMKKDSKPSRSRDLGNTLYLAPNELIEIIGGNLISIGGKVLDINYRSLSYGNRGNEVPKSISKESLEYARRVSRRGVGYHFQLSTSTKKDDPSTSLSNFVFDIDKEGILKVNIPKSSDTGNIPFASSTSYLTNSAEPSTEYANPSSKELIPVTLRDESGNIVFPKNVPQDSIYRETGVRYSNTDDNPYFPSQFGATKEVVRVNQTKYHNMYSIAERLLANRIVGINIPEVFVESSGFVSELAIGKPFEIPKPDTSNDGSESSSSSYPIYMSTIFVEPAEAAIDPGGDTTVAGKYYPAAEHTGEGLNEINKPLSNSFKLFDTGNELGVNTQDKYGRTRNKAGGISALMNFEGSIAASVGSDNIDNKSLIMDTEGSVLAWLGKDMNNRSFVMQTDGEVLINIGGSYSGENSEMNIGRLDLRVNLTDKGAVSSEYSDPSDEEDDDVSNPKAKSDFIISISENGIIVAGMIPTIPMILRNSGKILIESTEDKVIIKGTEVKLVETKGKSTKD